MSLIVLLCIRLNAVCLNSTWGFSKWMNWWLSILVIVLLDWSGLTFFDEFSVRHLIFQFKSLIFLIMIKFFSILFRLKLFIILLSHNYFYFFIWVFNMIFLHLKAPIVVSLFSFLSYVWWRWRFLFNLRTTFFLFILNFLIKMVYVLRWINFFFWFPFNLILLIKLIIIQIFFFLSP